jgi:hypothetical protein
MAVKRQLNVLGQMRVDVPALRSIESAVAGDFDLLAGTIMAGKTALIVNGFRLITSGITQATSLQLRVSDGIFIHFLASESGSMFHVPSDRDVETLNSTNPRIVGSWTPSQVNYIGLDVVRSADASTVDRVQFMDTNSLLETPKSVPLARTVDYRIVISTTTFDATPGIAPVARVEIDATGGIVDIRDARQIFWRLGSGGTSPNAMSSFPWPTGRAETGDDDFSGGDKSITSFKEWMDAVMTRLWEMGGGERWYSPTQDHNVLMARTGSLFTSSSEHFEWDGSNLHWKGLSLVFSNSTATTNTITDITVDTPGLTDLANGECIYVDLMRDTDAATLNAIKGGLSILGSPDVPGSRWVIAWRSGTNVYVRDQTYAVGASPFRVATSVDLGTVKLSATGLNNSAAPVSAAVTNDGIAIAAAITRGGATTGGTSTQGAGILTIGGGLLDTAIDIRTGGSGPASLRSDDDDLTLLAYQGNVLLQAIFSTTGNGKITVDAGADMDLKTGGTEPLRILSKHIAVNTGSLAVVGAANTLTVNTNMTSLVGATLVKWITTTDWGVGSTIHLRLASGVTIQHDVASPPANTASIYLQAGADVTTSTAIRMLSLIYDGTHWVEMGPIS